MARITQRGLAALGRNQKFAKWEKRRNMLSIKMLHAPKIRIEHEKQRPARL